MNNEKEVRKLIIKELPRFWGYVVLSFIFALIVQLISLIPPILMKKVVDTYIPAKDINNAVYCAILFALIPVVSTTISTIYNYCLNVTGRKMGQTLTILGFEKLMYQPIEYFDKHNSAELASYCKSEATDYVVFWIFEIPHLFAKILSGIVMFIMILNINMYIALGVLLYIPFSLLPSHYLSNKVSSYIKTVVENNAKASQIIADTFRGIKFIKTMLLENIQSLKLKQINNETTKIWSKTVAIDNLNGSWTNDFVDNLFIGVVFSLSAILIIDERLTLGMLLLILSYLPKVFSSIKTIANTNFKFKKKLAEYDKFFRLITMEDERGKNSRNLPVSFEDTICFNNVTFAYTEERGNVLNQFNCSIKKNQWIGIVGKSGSGKTTIFDLLLKLYDNYIGEIRIDGEEISNIATVDIRSKITKVSQEMFLFPGSIKDNLLLVKTTATEEELAKVIEQVELAEFINNLPEKINTGIGEDGVQLSGGEKQRLCLAQGILRESKILLLDEVTANIDVISEKSIKKTIKKIIKKNDITVLTISHRLDFLEDTDIIYIVEDGKILDKGEYIDLKQRHTMFNSK